MFEDVPEDKLQELVFDSPVPVILDVAASWCQPCKYLKPILEEAVRLVLRCRAWLKRYARSSGCGLKECGCGRDLKLSGACWHQASARPRPYAATRGSPTSYRRCSLLRPWQLGHEAQRWRPW